MKVSDLQNVLGYHSLSFGAVLFVPHVLYKQSPDSRRSETLQKGFTTTASTSSTITILRETSD